MCGGNCRWHRYPEHIPPDPGAALDWLKNRRPDVWPDRRELAGADGRPMELKTVTHFVDSKDQTRAK
jgi:hypothetical protein